MRKLKVYSWYGFRNGKQVSCVCAAASKAEVAKLDIHFRPDYGSATSNTRQVEAAMLFPGVVLYDASPKGSGRLFAPLEGEADLVLLAGEQLERATKRRSELRLHMATETHYGSREHIAALREIRAAILAEADATDTFADVLEARYPKDIKS